MFTFAEIIAGYMSKAAGGHRYLRRVPTGDPKRPWRYYYTMASLGRGVQHGEEISLGEGKKVKVAAIGDGNVTIEHADGKKETLSADQWHEKMHEAHGDSYTAAVDRRARSWASAIYRHVPRELLGDLQGKTPAEQLADLKERAPEVYAKLAASFKRAGVSEQDAKGMVAWVLQRRGWTADARASLLGAGTDLRHGMAVIKGYREIAGHAEKLAQGAKGVTSQHVAEALDKRKIKVGEAPVQDGASAARDKLQGQVDKTPKVQRDNLTTAEQFDALPVGTILNCKSSSNTHFKGQRVLRVEDKEVPRGRISQWAYLRADGTQGLVTTSRVLEDDAANYEWTATAEGPADKTEPKAESKAPADKAPPKPDTKATDKAEPFDAKTYRGPVTDLEPSQRIAVLQNKLHEASKDVDDRRVKLYTRLIDSAKAEIASKATPAKAAAGAPGEDKPKPGPASVAAVVQAAAASTPDKKQADVVAGTDTQTREVAKQMLEEYQGWLKDARTDVARRKLEGQIRNAQAVADGDGFAAGIKAHMKGAPPQADENAAASTSAASFSALVQLRIKRIADKEAKRLREPMAFGGDPGEFTPEKGGPQSRVLPHFAVDSDGKNVFLQLQNWKQELQTIKRPLAPGETAQQVHAAIKHGTEEVRTEHGWDFQTNKMPEHTVGAAKGSAQDQFAADHAKALKESGHGYSALVQAIHKTAKAHGWEGEPGDVHSGSGHNAFAQFADTRKPNLGKVQAALDSELKRSYQGKPEDYSHLDRVQVDSAPSEDVNKTMSQFHDLAETSRKDKNLRPGKALNDAIAAKKDAWVAGAKEHAQNKLDEYTAGEKRKAQDFRDKAEKLAPGEFKNSARAMTSLSQALRRAVDPDNKDKPPSPDSGEARAQVHADARKAMHDRLLERAAEREKNVKDAGTADDLYKKWIATSNDKDPPSVQAFKALARGEDPNVKKAPSTPDEILHAKLSQQGIPGKFKVHAGDDKQKEVSGTTYKGLGVHKEEASEGAYGKKEPAGWVVTHHGTGFSLGTSKTKAEATALRGAFAHSGVKWERHKTLDEVTSDPNWKAHARAINTSRNGSSKDSKGLKIDQLPAETRAQLERSVNGEDDPGADKNGKLPPPGGQRIDDMRKTYRAARDRPTDGSNRTYRGDAMRAVVAKHPDISDAEIRYIADGDMQTEGFSGGAPKHMLDSIVAAARSPAPEPKKPQPRPSAKATVASTLQNAAKPKPAKTPGADAASKPQQSLSGVVQAAAAPATAAASKPSQSDADKKLQKHAIQELAAHKERYPGTMDVEESARRSHLVELAEGRGKEAAIREHANKLESAGRGTGYGGRVAETYHKQMEGRVKNDKEFSDHHAAMAQRVQQAKKADQDAGPTPTHAQVEALSDDGDAAWKEYRKHYETHGENNVSYQHAQAVGKHADDVRKRFEADRDKDHVAVAKKAAHPGTPAKYKIQHADYASTKIMHREVEGTVYKGLGIHKETDTQSKGRGANKKDVNVSSYHLSHVGSGLSLGHSFSSKKAAETARGLFAHTGVDWEKNKTQDELRKDPNVKHVQAVAAAREARIGAINTHKLPTETFAHIRKNLGD